MLQKRADHDEEMSEMAAVETCRSATESSGKAEPKKDEERVSIFWRLFGGTILSIVALVTLTLYNNMSSSITDLRAEVSREREARAELVKKDEYSTRITAVYERMRGIDTIKVELEGMKEKVGTNSVAVDAAKRDATAAIEGVKKDAAVAIEGVKKDAAAMADSSKKDSAAVEVLKERVALLEAIKKDVAGLDALKERVTAATTELKAVRDEVLKVSGDIERNKLSDLERKSTRDGQYKQVDEAIKELQKAVQNCREKLARLEGAQPKAGEPAPASPGIAKPAAPAGPNDVKPAGGTTPPDTPEDE